MSADAREIRRWPRWAWPFGHPMRVQIDQTVPSDVAATQLDDVIATIERFLRVEGRVEEALGAVQWRCGGALGGTRVEFIPWRRGTKVRVTGRYWDSFLWLVLGAALLGWLPGTLVTTGLELGPSAGTTAIGIGYALTFLGVRAVWKGMGREQERGMVSLHAEIVSLASPSDPAAAPAESGSASGAPSVIRSGASLRPEASRPAARSGAADPESSDTS